MMCCTGPCRCRPGRARACAAAWRDGSGGRVWRQNRPVHL
jgi:hypothetical protein